MSDFILTEINTVGATLFDTILTTDVDSQATKVRGIDVSDTEATLFFMDRNARKIYRTTTDGNSIISFFSTTAVDSPALAARGLTYVDDTLLWGDTSQNKVYNTTTDGSSLISVVDLGFQLYGIDVNSDGTLWLTNPILDYVTNVTTDGTLISSFSTTDIDSLMSPEGIAYGSDTLWLADPNREKIYNCTTDGTSLINFFLSTDIDSQAVSPVGISYTSSNNIWFADNSTEKLYNCTTDGSSLITFFLSTDVDSQATILSGAALAEVEHLFYIDTNTNKIYKTTTDGNSIVNTILSTDIDSQATNFYGISCGSGDSLFATDTVKNKLYQFKSDGSSLYASVAISFIDSAANNPTGIEYNASSNNLYVMDSTTDKIYNVSTDISTIYNTIALSGFLPFSPSVISGISLNDDTFYISDLFGREHIYEITTDGTSLVNVFLVTNIDSSANNALGVSVRSGGLFFTSDETDKIYNIDLTGSIGFGYSTVASVSINPEYDYEFITNKVNRQDKRTRTGQLYTYIETGRFKEFTLPLNWVNSGDTSQINSWWELGTNLRYIENSDHQNSYYEVRIMGDENPFNNYTRPYFQEFYAGEIILQTV